MPEPIEPMVAGSAPSLVEAEQANKLIEAINQLGKMKGRSPIKITIDSDWKIDIELDAASETFGVVLEDNTAGEKIFFVGESDPFAEA